MPRSCTICTHPNRAEIEDAIVIRSQAKRRIAAQFGVTEQALRRHLREHLPELLKKAREAEEASRADELLRHLRALHSKTLSILLSAEGSGELRTALSAIREARGNLELLAKLSGELQQEGTVNLHLSPEYLEVRTAILVAVEPYPEAARAISRAMLGIESNGLH
jgi:hypothetical protein